MFRFLQLFSFAVFQTDSLWVSSIVTLHAAYFFMLLLSSAEFFRINFLKKSFRKTIRVSNSLDQGLDCLQSYQQTTFLKLLPRNMNMLYSIKS